MAKYKVWLTVKDKYGNTKKIDGGDINVDLASLTADELNHLEEALPLENYLKKSETEYLATDEEVSDATANTVKYSGFKFRTDNTEGTGN